MDYDTVLRLRGLVMKAGEGDKASKEKERLQQHIEQQILSKVDETDCPPLFMLAYVAKELTQPSLLYEELPTLLNVLAQIEHIRVLAEEQAQIALDLNRRYSKERKSGIRLLNGEERKELLGLLRGKAIIRLTYLDEIVAPLYRLYINYLWTSSHFTKVLKIMRMFFPSRFVKSGDPFADEHWKQMLHRDFSIEERKRVHEVGLETKTFLDDVRSWDLERKVYFEKLGLPEDEDYNRDFEAQFPRSSDEEALLAAIPDYLDAAQTLVNLLENLFPPSATKPTGVENS